MILKRFYDEELAQASYLIGCTKTGEAAVIDAFREVEVYLAAAADEGLRITAVTETHIHADFVSGSRELAERTGATLYLSDEGDDNWKYAFADQPNAVLVREGDTIRMGNIRLEVMATPGHTPEHITFVLYDEPASAAPLGAFTGDFIFVGDVGRPDLLERAAGVAGTMEVGGQSLFQSIQRFMAAMPDSLLLWPAHGSGSACGKSLGGVPVSSLGYEKTSNWGLKVTDEDSFVTQVLEGQPEPPSYFKEMKRINKVGPPLLEGFRAPARLGGSRLISLLEEDAVVVDIRDAGSVALESIPEVLHIAMNKSFTNWAGWMLPYDAPIYLIADSEVEVVAATRDLQKIGLDDVRGWMGLDALRAYERERGPLATIPQLRADEAAALVARGELLLIDVRGATEYEGGHIPGSKNIPLGYLGRELSGISLEKPVAVICEGGGRSPLGVSVIRRHGVKRVFNVPGGVSEYRMRALPVELGRN